MGLSRYLAAALLAAGLVIGSMAAAADLPGDKDVAAGQKALSAGDSDGWRVNVEKAAKKGNVFAMAELAAAYFYGDPLELDWKRSAYWAEMAAAKGDARANFFIARIYASPRQDIERPYPFDEAKAVPYFEKAFDGGFGSAGAFLGYYYASGKAGLPVDQAKAAYYYRPAVFEGYSSAAVNLGLQYERGEGVPKDLRAAKVMYLIAAQMGEPKPIEWLADMAETAPLAPEVNAIYAQGEQLIIKSATDAELSANKVKAMAFTRDAAERGHATAIAAMTDAHQYGRDGVEQDYDWARKWALTGAELGNDVSMTIVAQYFLKGTGGPVDLKAGRFWMEQSALSGNSLAMFYLAQIYDGDYGFPQNDALAIYWYKQAYAKGSIKAEKVLKDRGLLRLAPEQEAFIDRIERDGPRRTSASDFAFDVAQYCKFGGKKCHELSVASRRFMEDQNASAAEANMQRIWNLNSDKTSDAEARARSECTRRKTENLQRYTYGQQDWYYVGGC